MISQLYRTCAAGQPGLFSKVGLHTYVDPRLGGGKVNTVTKEDIVKLVEVEGKEWLFYKATPINVAFIRATSADPHGNLSMEKECLTLDCWPRRWPRTTTAASSLRRWSASSRPARSDPRTSRFPASWSIASSLPSQPEMHRMNYGVMYDPAPCRRDARYRRQLCRKWRSTQRKIIARRAAFELPPNGVINLGVGAPDGVANVANEEKVTPYLVMTTEAGAVGGVLAGGSSFGSSANAHSVLDQNQMFDFYHGGGLDLTCLGMAECD